MNPFIGLLGFSALSLFNFFLDGDMGELDLEYPNGAEVNLNCKEWFLVTLFRMESSWLN